MKTKIIIAIVTILLMFVVGYILFDKGSEYLQGQKMLYYNQGADNGIIYWNNQVIDTFNAERKVPYILNDTIQKVDLVQWCRDNVG